MFTSSPRSSAQSAQVKNPSAQQSATTGITASPAAAETLARLQSAAGNQIAAHVSRETGVYDFVRVKGTGILSADSALATPEARARNFLSVYGALVGMSDVERGLVTNLIADGTTSASALKVAQTFTDRFGATHVRFDQTYRGLNVFGAQLVVHMNSRGITAVNGSFVPGIKLSTTPKITTAKAGQMALGAMNQESGENSLSITSAGLGVYRKGLLEGYRGESVLAYDVKIADSKGPRSQVLVDARTSEVLLNVPLRNDALYRLIFTGTYAGNDATAVHTEDMPPVAPGPTANLFHYAGHVYNLYMSGFGRDNYDGKPGTKMRSVYLINQVCPNAYWNGQTTNYCPEIDGDDVVAHEWTHAYTQYTHKLVYAYQSGALNESYSDIFGETVDLMNGVDGDGGSNNAQPRPNGQRWQIGEDVDVLNDPLLGIFRDMWTPTDYGDPDKVSSGNYHCSADDGGGVHTNSGVPNHAFAMLVDGKTFNGQTVQGIGFTKALHIYWRAMSVYQTATTNFAQHEQALLQSCQDLTGQNLNALSTSSTTGTPSGQIITATDCQQVAKAMAAVEMSQIPTQCNFTPVLNPNTPAACPGAEGVFTETWEDGNMDGWALASTGTFPSGWPNFNWVLDNSLPQGRAGTAAFAVDPPDGVCGDPTGDYSGKFSMDSPTITVPAGAADLRVSFDHFVQTEANVDGGNLYISVGGGLFTLIPQDKYVFNAPSSQLRPAPPVDQNTNPKAGERAWTGSNPLTGVGSWGTTIVDLSSFVQPGQNFKLRWEFGLDGCGGADGWYVDNISVYNCPLLEAPVLSVGTDYENPDTDGSYTLNWIRPAGAVTGPDLLQESTTSCAPLLFDNAENGTGQWTTANSGPVAPIWQTSPAKPQHTSNAFWANPVSEQETQGTSATLTFNNPITIPLAGTTTLSFLEWYFNENDDRGFVDVSTNDGTTWATVYTNARDEGLLPDAGAAAFANEPLTLTQIDLTPYAGQTIRLRFRFALGDTNSVFWTQYGWYVDDISVTSDNWTDVATVNGNSRTLTGQTDGSRCHRVRTTYDFGAGPIPGPFSNLVNVTVDLVCPVLTNVALGATASASSEYVNGGYPASSAIDGEHKGLNWGNNGGWNDSTRDTYPDWLEIAFDGTKTLTQIIVYTVQNNVSNPEEPTPLTPADLYGIEDFDVQYWDGDSWETVTGGNVVGNDKAMRVFAFAPVETTKIRVMVNKGRSHWSRITEVEAFGCSSQ
jgi:Zn-dependent metalloprotease